jgi:tetratricopeptide (TPR) repeat protein
MVLEDPHVRSRRRSIVVTAVLTVLVLGAVAAKVTSMLLAQDLGERAWQSGDLARADRYFAITDHGNVAERWVAPYNRGVVAYGEREWNNAAAWFESALDVAPDSARCRITLNWSWTIEAAGDELKAAGDADGAARRWAEAENVLDQAVGCAQDTSSEQPTEARPRPGEDKHVDPTSEQQQVEKTQQRIDLKLSGDQSPPAAPPGEKPSQDQATRLADRNADAARARQGAQDQTEDPQQPTEGGEGTDRVW